MLHLIYLPLQRSSYDLGDVNLRRATLDVSNVMILQSLSKCVTTTARRGSLHLSPFPSPSQDFCDFCCHHTKYTCVDGEALPTASLTGHILLLSWDLKK